MLTKKLSQTMPMAPAIRIRPNSRRQAWTIAI